jgi:hypothetical protein
VLGTPLLLKLRCGPRTRRKEDQVTHPVGREEKRPRSRPGGEGRRSCVVGLESDGRPAESVKRHEGKHRGQGYREVAKLLSRQRCDAEVNVDALATDEAIP